MSSVVAIDPKANTDPETGLTLPLSRSLDSQEFHQHRALVGFEIEVLAKKTDRFGWERDRNTAAHDRVILDWIDALADFPLVEVQAACKHWIRDHPRKMPNEGDVLKIVNDERRKAVARHKAELAGPVAIADKSNPPKFSNRRDTINAERARQAEIIISNAFGEREEA